MKRLLHFLLLLPTFLYAEIDIPFDFEASTNITLDQRENHFQTTLHNQIIPHVNPITGDLIEEETDLVVAGSEPLSLRRFYSHSALYEPRYGGWRYNPESFLVANFEWGEQERFAAVGEESGEISSFHLSNTPYTLTLANPQTYAHFHPSGQAHPLNTQVHYHKIGDPKNKYRFEWRGEVTDGSGKVRTFTSPMHTWFRNVTFTKDPDCYLFPLED